MEILSGHLAQNGEQTEFSSGSGDSFRWPIMHYLAEHFSRSVYFDARFALLDEELIQHEKPDLVIFATHGLFYVNAPTPESLIKGYTIRYQIEDHLESSQQKNETQ